MNSINLIALAVIVVALQTHGNVIPENRIVGGQNAGNGQFPFMASLAIRGGVHICGATIINTRWLLTAAHCTVNRQPFTLVVRVGSILHIAGGHLHPVQQIRMHPGFTPTQRTNDVSTVQTQHPMIFGFGVGAAQLTNTYHQVVPATVAGWGNVAGSTGALSQILQFLNTNTLTNAECHQRLVASGFPVLVAFNNICTFTRVGQGICTGDNGGPLFVGSELIGIVSFGIPCAAGVPDVYTRVSTHLQWIQHNSF